MFDVRTKIAARIKACRIEKDWTYKEAASNLSAVCRFKVGTSRYGNWEQAINIPPAEMLIAMGQMFGKPAAWLSGLSDDDGTSPVAELYTVPMAEPISTANGLLDLGDDALSFRRTFLEEAHMDQGRVLLVVAPDDSMSGVIAQGDRVLIDLSDTRVQRDDLFALIVNGRLWLRWIRMTLDSSYCIQAEMRDRYPDEIISAQALESMHILGRVRLIANLR